MKVNLYKVCFLLFVLSLFLLFSCDDPYYSNPVWGYGEATITIDGSTDSGSEPSATAPAITMPANVELCVVWTSSGSIQYSIYGGSSKALSFKLVDTEGTTVAHRQNFTDNGGRCVYPSSSTSMCTFSFYFCDYQPSDNSGTMDISVRWRVRLRG